MSELAKLKDGGIVDIHTDMDKYWRGCETCGYGENVDVGVEVIFVNGYAKIVVTSHQVGMIILKAIQIVAAGATHITEAEFVDGLNEVVGVPWSQFVYKKRR